MMGGSKMHPSCQVNKRMTAACSLPSRMAYATDHSGEVGSTQSKIPMTHLVNPRYIPSDRDVLHAKPFLKRRQIFYTVHAYSQRESHKLVYGPCSAEARTRGCVSLGS